MGTTMAVSYANIFMAVLEEEILKKFYWEILFPPLQAPFLTTFWEVNDTLKHR
jgi:hypothetical protein